MAQDGFQEAKELYTDCVDAWRDNFERMREDFKFSNPADPRQWDSETLKDRDGRVTLTLDQTNQYINQVVNDGRMNTPAMSAVPASGDATKAAAEQITGLFRHIEYVSKAPLAYDTSLEHSSRVGLGWLRAFPKVLRPELNEQEMFIASTNEPTNILIDGNSVALDGNDSLHGFCEMTYSEKEFKRKWPKATASSFADAGNWYTDKGIKVAEFFKVIFTKENRIGIMLPGGQLETVTEDEYWAYAAKLGHKPVALNNFEAIRRTVKWCHMSGVEFLEESTFPGPWVPLVPVYGHLLFVEGERYVCGLTRRLMNGQRMHNYQMTSLAESLLEQPKAPYMTPALAIANHERHWQAFNKGNPAFLPYDHIDDDGNPIPAPTRQPPPAFPSAFAQAALIGQNEMQAAVGMFKSTLGQQSNAVSGKAKLADKLEGDTATFHYRDNQRISIEHLARICIDAFPEIYDSPRVARIMGIDQKVSHVQIDPDMPQSVKMQGKKVLALNPNVGVYDAAVKIGPAHTTLREEFQDRLSTLGQGNPALAAAMAPLLIKMSNVPEAEKVAKVAIALLPPPVQAIYNENEGEQGEAASPQVQQLTQQLQQAAQVLQNMQQQLQEAQQAAQSKQGETAVKAADVQVKQASVEVDRKNAETAAFAAETERLRIEDERADMLQKQEDDMSQLAEQNAMLLNTLQQIGQGIAALLDKASEPRDESGDALVIDALSKSNEATIQAIGQLAQLVVQPKIITPERDPATGRISRIVATNQESTRS